jgi:hypothetical protein
MVEQLIAGQLRAVGLEFGSGLPKPIPAEHFTVPLRSITVVGDDDPPLIAVGDAIQGGTNLYAGAINWVDPDYDERTGEVLSPVYPATCLDIDGGAIYADGQPHWTDVVIVSSNAEGANNKKNGKSGRKPKWDWKAIEIFVFDQMDHHGEFSAADDPKWRGAADLEAEIQKQFRGADGGGPAHSTLQEHLPGMLERWRKTKASQ